MEKVKKFPPKRKKKKQHLIRDWREEYNPDVLQILPEAKFPCTLTGSDFTDKGGLNSDWYYDTIPGEEQCQ